MCFGAVGQGQGLVDAYPDLAAFNRTKQPLGTLFEQFPGRDMCR
jgi:hypothetical protein